MRDMDPADAQRLLEGSRFGILGLADGGRAYGLPLYFGYDGTAVYFHCHPGTKDGYFSTTEEACLTVVHIDSENIWESVQVFGPVQVLSLSSDLEAAKSALFNVPFPPAEGNYPSGLPVRSPQDVEYVRLQPARLSGKFSTFPSPEAKASRP